MTKVIENSEKHQLLKALFLLAAVACLCPFVNGPIALVSGFLFTHFLGHPFLVSNPKAVKWLLKIAIVGLGFGINVQEAMMAGKSAFSLTVASIVLILIIGFFIGRALKIQSKITHLISSGTAICGGSAIAAVAAVIKASEKDISIALGVVFFLNSIALIIFPMVGHYFNLSQSQFGLWAAIAIHDTSSVVGAAVTYGEEALNVATTVKLARALWIIPLSIISVYWFKGKNSSVSIPWFILLFVMAILMNSYLNLPTLLTASVPTIAKAMLVLTLFLIGAGLSVEKIKAAGWKPMGLGIILWVVISIGSLLVILNMF